MMKHLYMPIIIVLAAAAVFGCSQFPDMNRQSENQAQYLSPVSIAVDCSNAAAYIACGTAPHVSVFDLDSRRIAGEIALNGNSGGCALSADGSVLYAVSGVSDGIVEFIDTASGNVLNRVDVGHTPCSPVLSLDGNKLFVCNRFGDTVSVIDTKLKEKIAAIPMMREPVACALSPDGKYLYVANHLPSNKQIDDYIVDGGYMDVKGYSYNSMYAATSVVIIVDTETYRFSAIIQLPKGSHSLRGICASPDGNYIYVTHLLANYLVPPEHIEEGGIHKNTVTVIDAVNMDYSNTFALDDTALGAANPWGVTCSPDDKYLIASHAGTHEISIIDRNALHARLDRLQRQRTADPDSVETLASADLNFLRGIRRRLSLGGKGPRAIAVTGRYILAGEYFTDSIAMIGNYGAETPAISSVALGPVLPMSAERKGELLFNDGDICRQKWQSCASCHPDGRQDGLTWDLLNDGAGNPKSTKSLLLSHKTPPAMVSGVRASAEVAVRAGIEHILFADRPEQEARAIDAYLLSLKDVPSPRLEHGRLNRYARRGRRVFKKAGCMECHPPPYYTNMKWYNVGTGWGDSRDVKYDTPTLIEVWRTSPYLYDGRADSMYKVLRTYNRRDVHGKTLDLNLSEINDLNEFILSL